MFVVGKTQCCEDVSSIPGLSVTHISPLTEFQKKFSDQPDKLMSELLMKGEWAKDIQDSWKMWTSQGILPCEVLRLMKQE